MSDRGLPPSDLSPELTNEIKRLWEAVDDVGSSVEKGKVLEQAVPYPIGLSQVSDPLAEPEEADALPGKVLGLTLTNEALYTDPTSGITLASVKVAWDDNAPEVEVDLYEVFWFEA